MGQHYTDADADAVAKSLWTDTCGPADEWPRLAPSFRATLLTDARAVLDAVAPAIAARALREFATNRVGNQTPARMAEDMLARADEIEAGR